MKRPRFFKPWAWAALGLSQLLPLHAYEFLGYSWPNGNIPLQLQLGTPPATLIDGVSNWDDVGVTALTAWNAGLVRSKFTYVKDSTAAKSVTNRLNNVFFDSKIYGEDFGERVLAVTAGRSSGLTRIEADVVVNTKYTWNSYRGTLRSSPYDLQRVLLHEFGHVLGLNHPDLATPPQSVTAIMNSAVSNTDALQSDDLAGADQLYGNIPPPDPAGNLANVTVAAGSPLSLALTNTSSANTRYTWTFTRLGGSTRILLDGDGNPWTSSAFTLFSAQSSDAGTYSVAAINGSLTSAYVSAQVNVTAVNTVGSRLPNLSARARAGSGDDTFIVGFVINGSTAKRVMIRAVGPTLVDSGIASPLADPKLKLFKSGSDGTSTQIGENDNWSADATEATALRTTASRLGASALSNGSKDAAMLVTLVPGVYSAIVDAQGGQPGIALVEAYDADDSVAQGLTRPLVNVSTRSYSGTGDQVLIAGFVIDGPVPKQVLIRAVGPGLLQYGITTANTDPNLLLFKGSTRIADNDDWSFSNQSDILPAVFTKIGAGQLTSGSNDSALLITLPPGVYSAQAAGRRDQTGTILLEIYEVAP